MAQTVVQDTFVAAFKSFHTFRYKSSYFTWLCKIALNKMTDYYRHQVNYRSRYVVPTLTQLNSLADPGLNPEEKASLQSLCRSVNSCLDMLPSQYRRLLHLKYYRELSSKEIQVMLDLTPRQLEGRLRRARVALARVISSLHPEIRP